MKNFKQKKYWLMIPLALAGILALVNPSCDLVVEDQCDQAEICTGKNVTSCCSETECYYTYNGKRYETDDASLNQLAVDLGCSTSSSETYQDDIEAIKMELLMLHDRVALVP